MNRPPAADRPGPRAPRKRGLPVHLGAASADCAAPLSPSEAGIGVGARSRPAPASGRLRRANSGVEASFPGENCHD